MLKMRIVALIAALTAAALQVPEGLAQPAQETKLNIPGDKQAFEVRATLPNWVSRILLAIASIEATEKSYCIQNAVWFPALVGDPRDHTDIGPVPVRSINSYCPIDPVFGLLAADYAVVIETARTLGDDGSGGFSDLWYNLVICCYGGVAR